MNPTPKRSLIEKLATTLKIIPNLDGVTHQDVERAGDGLNKFPPPDKWDSWTEYDANSWPHRQQREYMIVPTTCFNANRLAVCLATSTNRRWKSKNLKAIRTTLVHEVEIVPKGRPLSIKLMTKIEFSIR